MPEKHARFSPSSADRFIHCPPALRLGEEYGPEDTSTNYTKEGTEAHALCEHLLRLELGEASPDPRPNFKYYTPEMEEAASGYRDAVLEIRDSHPGSALFVEQEIHFEDYAEGAFGTSDALILSEPEMFVVDFKYGKGVPVSAEDNAQLKCYALGAYIAFSPLYEIEQITLVIYQPRLNNYSSWSLTTESLLTWADKVLRPAAAQAIRGDGDFACGSWCRFCKAKAVCRKRAEENLSLARYDFARPKTLEPDEINLILSKVDSLTAWAEDIRSYALQQALAGQIWDDWKVVEGRSNRKFRDETTAARTLEEAGISPYERRMKTLTEIEKEIGKKRFAELLGENVTKPAGRPTLVPRTDKRPEIITSAAVDFAAQLEEENAYVD